MTTTFTNSADAREGSLGGADYTIFAHPDYTYNKEDWVMIRDAIAGERRIKEKTTTYLPSLNGKVDSSYQAYKERASFVNMTARTLFGLAANAFRRPVKVYGAEKSELSSVSLDGDDIDTYAKKLGYELIGLGRVGVLVDMPVNGGAAYFSEYVAENILSWKTEIINGRRVPTYVLLREIDNNAPKVNDTLPTVTYVSGKLQARYRMLELVDGVYRQSIYRDLGSPPLYTIVPTRNGKPLDFIPMVIFGTTSLSPDVQKSPLLDIVQLNIAHYRVSAQLEHGRYYTALPVYYVTVRPGEETPEYAVGPEQVWEVPTDSKPGILEYTGHGLNALTSSLTEKERHIEQLAGRIMGNTAGGAPENSDVYKLRQANELAILSNVTEVLSIGLTRLVNWARYWERKSEGITIKVPQDFKAVQIAARELRAISLLYNEGLLPVQEVYRVFQDSGFVQEDTTLEQFIALLKSANNFPNNPDIAAKQEGYADAEAKREAEAKEEEKRRNENVDAEAALRAEMFKQGVQTQQLENGT